MNDAHTLKPQMLFIANSVPARAELRRKRLWASTTQRKRTMQKLTSISKVHSRLLVKPRGKTLRLVCCHRSAKHTSPPAIPTEQMSITPSRLLFIINRSEEHTSELQ